ncbi:Phosphoglycerate kinase [Corchorus olitorius]|uniref:Phosphoglycerate kinase n=1 Tax=Corchorus olitorius TaxID=93759 RepID=A0A1R3HTH6_9ROSI|nr:Phosphoglycerate kinase [Corchorus olitorius]
MKFLRHGSWKYPINNVQSSLQGGLEVVTHVESSHKEQTCLYDGVELEALPHIQTLKNFPKEELFANVVMVRFDSNILLGEKLDWSSQSASKALYTIKYLHKSGAKVILVSSWKRKKNSELLAAEAVADILSSVLQHKVVALRCISCDMPVKGEDLQKADIFLLENLSDYKEEVSNCSKFAELLSSEVDIFVNDSFSQSHKVLASTVGVARFCYASMAGFLFEESLHQLKKTAKTNKKPYIAIIGGGNLNNKAAAIEFLASRCDALVFVGLMSFQIMHALGHSVPTNLLEREAHKTALDIVQFAHEKHVLISYPEDFWCVNQHLPKQMGVFPAHGVLDGWLPVDLGPKSLDEINSLVTNSKRVIWIGPVKFKSYSPYTGGTSKLAQMLYKQSQCDCEVTIVGSMAHEIAKNESGSVSSFNMLENASAVWEFLKGQKLPGVVALDRAYPFEIDWNVAYCDPSRPLVVDIGSGNGLFIMGMARKRKDLNFLGLEINGKLVRRCLDSVHQSGITNGYFIETNATSTFRSIVSSYPGELVLASIQCPNPDFNKPEHRWRMLQRSLIEAVADLLASKGKVFLQSDVEEVAMRMKELFLKYGKGKLCLSHDHHNVRANGNTWLEENPYGIRSDWEQHVLDRGAPILFIEKLSVIVAMIDSFLEVQSSTVMKIALPDNIWKQLQHTLMIAGHAKYVRREENTNFPEDLTESTFPNETQEELSQSTALPHPTSDVDDDIFAEARKSGLDIRYSIVSDGFPLGFDRSLNHDQFFEGVLHVMSAHIDELVANTFKQSPPPTCLIADTFYVWSSMISNKYNLVNVSFWTEPALVFTLYYHLDLLRANGHFACTENRKDIIDYIPGVRAIEPKDMMSYLQASDISTVVHRIIFKAFEDVKKADFIICNTVEELEHETISALQEKQPTYAIGPIFPTGFTKSVVATSLWSESDCTQWLDTKPHGSVLYVSFGSYAHVSKIEIAEVANGLLLSGKQNKWDKVAEKIHHVIGGKSNDDDELRKNIKEVKRKLENALSAVGSSEKNFNQFIRDMEMKSKKKRASAMCCEVDNVVQSVQTVIYLFLAAIYNKLPSSS